MIQSLNSRFLLSAVVLIATISAAPASADDRRLISGFEEIPTVFFLFDTSGSMHWSAQCTQEDFDAGDCDYLCPSGSCWVPGAGDHPSSKLYQAKAAMYEVIEETNDLHVGFATFNQDEVRLLRKHWIYEALEDGPMIPGWGPYPRGRDNGPPLVAGDLHTFGATFDCTTGNGDDRLIGCAPATPADLAIQWDRQRMEAWPKHTPELNSGNDASRTFYVHAVGENYEIRFTALAIASNHLSDPVIEYQIRKRHCLDAGCGSWDQEETVDVDFGFVTDFDNWEFRTDRGPYQAGFFSQGTASDGPATNTCRNWDANTDTPQDIFDSQNLRQETVADPDFPGLLDLGDVVPIDWRKTNQQTILERLAPNLVLTPAADPDFRVATYFEDDLNPTNKLLLDDAREKPILAFGSTPIGTSVKSFYDYMEGVTGWVNVAANNDPSAACRETYLIIVTDGNQSTCDSDDPCATDGTTELFSSLGVETFVVAFGVPPHIPYLPRCSGATDEVPNVTCCEGGGEPLCIPSDTPGLPPDEWPVVTNPARPNRSLRCMASTGGTGDEDYDLDGDIDSENGPGVIYPQNQQELIDALVSILDQIRPAPAAFATASVPSVQAEAADKVFLSDFTPVAERSNWIGRVNAFLKPVPINEDNEPDTSRICPPDDLEDPTDDPSACLLWEAGDVIVNNQINPGDPIGDLVGQRRVYYAEFDGGVPRRRHFFEETVAGSTPLAQEFDLWRGFDLDFDPLDSATHDPARTAANAVIDFTLSVKTTPLNDDFPVPIDYVLTDIFHSDPLFLTAPGNLLYFLDDVDGYRDFAMEHAFRRRILLFGANGGMLHGLDAGVCREVPLRNDPRPCIYDNGTGFELFASMPRSAMPTVRELAESLPRHRFTVDGRTQATDVRIDPIHDGVDSLANPPNADDREWRSVLIGGLREGGNVPPEDRGDLSSPADSNPDDGESPTDHPTSGYYALDLTQPDPLPIPPAGESPIPSASDVPDCLRTVDGITPAVAGCGPIAFASTLWEFTDSIDGVRLDEDDNGFVDLAFAWSNPNIGRIQICLTGCEGPDPTLEDRYVMIIGGGFDPDAPYQRGNFIYLIDVETGEAIYKRPVMGAVAAEPAAVDTNFDGYIDTVYFGTSLGLLYRITLDPLDVGGSDPKYPEATLVNVTETAQDATVVSRSLLRITDPDFGPFVILETTDPATIPPEVRPIFFRPSVIFLSEFNRYAVALGTGNRENIFQRQDPTGRFFTFVDNVTPATIMSPAYVPFSPASAALTALTPTSSTLGDTNLLKPGEGWWLELALDERLIAEPFALSGILFFSTFIPDPDGPVVIDDASLCREKGVSNIYGVFTTNADGLLSDDPDISSVDDLVRFVTVEGLVSSPFTEQSQTKNPPPDDDTVQVIDALDSRLKFIRDRLKTQFPGNCTFPPGYRIDVKTRNSGTGIDFIAPVPICVVEKSFRDF